MYNKYFINAVVVSIILHILLMLFLQYSQKLFPTANNGAAPIEVYLDQPNGGWKIADITNSLNNQKPDNPKFLGLQNQSVKDETVSTANERGTGQKGRGDGLKPGSGKDQQQAQEKQKQKPQEAHKSKEIKNLYDFDGKLFAMKPNRAVEKNPMSGGSNGKGEGGMPEDFYPDYKIGVHTYLNVLRYPDVEYFVRMKRIFKMTWNPVGALQRDMQANTVSRGSVMVVLGVAVDKSGSLSELFVLRSSGMPNYDNEALRTIRSSSPFSAPPSKFIDKEGVLRMSWTFVVYI